jgi:limonene-1,2-epoxide hydrolase
MENKIDLTVELVKEKWSKTYNPNGKPDWSHIFGYYHEDIIFQDSIQKVVGFNDFEAMCNRLTKRCKSLRMELHEVTKSGNVIFLEWTMTMAFRIFPSTPMYGSTKLLLGEDGRIIEQRDYYDLWGDIANGVPIWRKIYRYFMRVFFG